MALTRIYVACLASYNNGRLHGRWIDATADKDAMRAEIAAMLRESPYPTVTVTDYETPARAAGWIESDLGLPVIRGAEAVASWKEACAQDGLQPVKVPSAEEWAVHDYGGAHPHAFGEYPSLDSIVAYVELLGEAEKCGVDRNCVHLVADHFGDPQSGSFDNTREALTENFAGEHDSLTDWVESHLDETGFFSAHQGEFYSDRERKVAQEYADKIKQYFDFKAYARDCELGGDVFTIEHGGKVLVFWSR